MRATFFQNFLRTEAIGGLILLVAAVAALIVANSPLAPVYDAVWATPLVIGPEGHPLALSARGWVNDGLMAAFFLLVGLEIKRELLVGELSSVRQAALPFAAAVGGVAVPALVYIALAGPEALKGWAIPTATDIAFALGVLALVAPGAPAGLKVFLAALAIVDDMCAVVVIALFYTAQVEWMALAWAAGIVAALVALNSAKVYRLTPYLLLGVALWYLRPRIRRARHHRRRGPGPDDSHAHPHQRGGIRRQGARPPRGVRAHRDRRPDSCSRARGSRRRCRRSRPTAKRWWRRSCGSSTRCIAPAPTS